MNQIRSPFQSELLKRVNEVMHYLWDPIGVAGSPEARDEYDSYVPHVFSLLLRKEKGEIAAYLYELATERMGLTGSAEMKQEAERIEALLGDWRELMEERERQAR